MAYLPPFARMRQIKRDTVRPERDPVPVPTEPPANVSEALAQTPEAVYVIEEPEVAERTIKPVEVVVPEPVEPEPAPEPVVPEPVVPEPAPVEPEPKVKAHPQMKKSELVVIAANLGLPLSDEMTKAQILDAIKAAGH